MPLDLTLHATIEGLLSAAVDTGTSSFPILPDVLKPLSLLDGTGSGQVSKFFQDRRNIAASSTGDLDLNGGGLVSPLGASLNFSTIKVVLIRAYTTNVNNIIVGGASNPLLGIFDHSSDKARVHPGGWFFWVSPGSGVTVTADTGDILGLANGGSGTGVDMIIEIAGT